LGEERDVPLSLMAETIIWPNDYRPSTDLLVNDVLNEVMGFQLGELSGKLNNYKDIDAGFLYELHFLFMRGDKRWPIAWTKDFDGVWHERHD
jgi:hypothetical protein